MIDLARFLTAQARVAGVKPRLHPNGFVQLDLIAGGALRLHIWPERWAAGRRVIQESKHPIHDHNFDMQSWVVRGELENLTYVTVKPNVREERYQMHAARPVHYPETILEPQGDVCGVALFEWENVRAGEKYAMPYQVLHDSRPAEGRTTVTLMAKTKVHEYNPVVAVPVGVKPDNTFRRDATDVGLLWATIEKSLI